MNKAVFAVLTIASVSAVMAQRPAPSARHTPEEMHQREMDHLATRLTLTDAQKERATTVYTAAHTATAALRESTKQAHEALRTAIKNNDTVTIDRAALQLGNLAAQEMSIRSKADAAFRQTLTADQQAKFDKSPMAGRGPGGPAGPRPQGHRPPPPPAL